MREALVQVSTGSDPARATALLERYLERFPNSSRAERLRQSE